MSSVLDKKDIATTVRDLAKKHQVAYVRTSLDDLADNITRLSGDDVAAPDEIQELLIALRRGPTPTINTATSPATSAACGSPSA